MVQGEQGEKGDGTNARRYRKKRRQRKRKTSYVYNIDDGSGNADRSEVGEVLDLSPEDLRFFLSLV